MTSKFSGYFTIDGEKFLNQVLYEGVKKLNKILLGDVVDETTPLTIRNQLKLNKLFLSETSLPQNIDLEMHELTLATIIPITSGIQNIQAPYTITLTGILQLSNTFNLKTIAVGFEDNTLFAVSSLDQTLNSGNHTITYDLGLL